MLHQLITFLIPYGTVPYCSWDSFLLHGTSFGILCNCLLLSRRWVIFLDSSWDIILVFIMCVLNLDVLVWDLFATDLNCFLVNQVSEIVFNANSSMGCAVIQHLLLISPSNCPGNQGLKPLNLSIALVGSCSCIFFNICASLVGLIPYSSDKCFYNSIHLCEH